MPENDAGIVNTLQAMSLLTLETPAELDRLVKGGWIKPEAPDRWRLVALVQGFARWARWQANVATTEQLAACWSITKARVGQISGEGWFKPLEGKRGHFNWQDANSGYVRYLKDAGRRASKSASESRVRDARAADLEMRTAERQRKLVHVDDSLAAMDMVVGSCRAEFSGLPTRFTRDLMTRNKLAQEVDASLTRVADTLAECAASLRAGRISVKAGRPLNS